MWSKHLVVALFAVVPTAIADSSPSVIIKSYLDTGFYIEPYGNASSLEFKPGRPSDMNTWEWQLFRPEPYTEGDTWSFGIGQFTAYLDDKAYGCHLEGEWDGEAVMWELVHGNPGLDCWEQGKTRLVCDAGVMCIRRTVWPTER